jgi:hypothetical protein
MRFAHRVESASSFATQNGVSVSSLYRWQAEQCAEENFSEIKPDLEPTEDFTTQSVAELVVARGNVRFEFRSLPDLSYLESVVNLLAP